MNKAFTFFLLLMFGQHLLAQKSHPYLFYTSARINHLKERIKSDATLDSSWNALKLRCDSSLSKPKGGSMEELALAYNMTADKRYAERAKALLLDLVSKTEWDGMDDRTPRWNSGLNTGHMNYQASITFDGIYNYLTPGERNHIAERIVSLGIRPTIDDWISKDKRIQSLNNMGHNWWSAIVFEGGLASLAVMNEIPEAKKWAGVIMEDSKEWFAFTGSPLDNKIPTFDPSGGLYESIGYANYAVSEYLLFRLAWTNSQGTIHMPYDDLLQKTMDWFINASYPRSEEQLMSLNFGDSNDFANGDKPVKLMIAIGLGKEYYWWYLNQTGRGQFREDLGVGSPLGMVYQPEEKRTTSLPLPLSAQYSKMGWGMLRNSWNPNATLLGVKCGYTWNHAHADAGSFVLYHNGQYLLIDGGDVNYANDEYSSYFVTSRAHNVLMFNGEAQDPQDQYHAVKTPGHLYNLLDGGKLKYILADATGPTSKNFLRNYRNFLWIGNVILVIDDVHTYDIGQFDFLLHYRDTAMKKGPDLEITSKNAGILFRPLYPETLPTGYPHDFPEKMKYRIEYGLKDRTTNVKIPYYVITPPVKSDRTKIINAILLLGENNKTIETFTGSSGANAAAGRTNLPMIEKFEGMNYLGVRITQNGETTDVYVKLLADGRLMHRNSSINMNGWETDAYISAFTYKQGSGQNSSTLSSYFISNGSYLRRDNKVLVSSLSKVFLNVEKEKELMDVELQGQPLINLSLAEKPGKLRVNGEVVNPRYDSDKMLLIQADEAAKPSKSLK
jgi:oligo-alginate lyase